MERFTVDSLLLEKMIGFLRSLRRKIKRFLYSPVTFWRQCFNALIAFLILVSVAIIPLQLMSQFSSYHHTLWLFEAIVMGIFTIEYLLRSWSVKGHATSWFGLIDLMAILPFYLLLFDVFTLFDLPKKYVFILIVLRFLRIFKLWTAYERERLALRETRRANGDDQFSTDDNERVVEIVYKHPLFLFFSVLPPIIMISTGIATVLLFNDNWAGIALGALAFVVAIINFVKIWLDFHFDVIYITDRRLVIQNRSLFGSRANDIPYEAITNLRPNTATFFRYFFHFGDICIETASGRVDRRFTYARNPNAAVKRIIHQRYLMMVNLGYRTNTMLDTDNNPPPVKIKSVQKIFTLLRDRVRQTSWQLGTK